MKAFAVVGIEPQLNLWLQVGRGNVVKKGDVSYFEEAICVINHEILLTGVVKDGEISVFST